LKGVESLLHPYVGGSGRVGDTDAARAFEPYRRVFETSGMIRDLRISLKETAIQQLPSFEKAAAAA